MIKSNHVSDCGDITALVTLFSFALEALRAIRGCQIDRSDTAAFWAGQCIAAVLKLGLENV